MPETVKVYAETGSFKESFAVQAEICDTLRLDFAKYAPHTDNRCLDAVFTASGRNVGQQTKYVNLAEGFANPTIKKAYETLCLAGVIRKISSADPSGLPLGARASGKIFKTIITDLGIMRHLSGMPADVEYAAPDLLGIYRGALAEQFAGQELAASQKEGLYYWSRPAKSSSAEVDYLVSVAGTIHPVEVKSGSAGRLRSLHLFRQTYPNAGPGLVFSTRPYAELPVDKIIFVPLYSAYSATGGKGIFSP
jgi:uncharacterized protein